MTMSMLINNFLYIDCDWSGSKSDTNSMHAYNNPLRDS
jgi:hypothetical protein